METYESLTDMERQAIERALDCLQSSLWHMQLANDDRAARAAEALAVYVVSSREAVA